MSPPQRPVDAQLRERIAEVAHLIGIAGAVMLGATQLAALGDSKRMVDAMRMIVVEASRAIRDAREAHVALLQTFAELT